MRYFVIGEDGQKYGPADIVTLQAWIGEARLLPDQQVEEEGSGIRMVASAVNGLQFPAQTAQQAAPRAPFQAPEGGVPSGSPYYRPMDSQMVGDNGQGDVTIAWVLAAIGAAFCCLGIVLQPIAITFANRAISKGNPGGNAPKIFSSIFLVLSVVLVVGYILMVVFALNSGLTMRPPSRPI